MENSKVFYICEEKLDNEDNCYRKAKESLISIPMEICTVHFVCNLRYAVPKEIPIILHNGSNFHFHIK